MNAHHVTRAVILAAGRGSRLAPLTDHLPKPLVPVNGMPIIATILDALNAAGISSITIVRGYCGAALDTLKDAYPHIAFLDNPDWAAANNISSIALAGRAGLLEDSYVIEGDLYLAHPAIITPTQERTNYIAFPVAATDDWCFDADADGRITHIATESSHPCHQMLGLSYWAAEDGRRLAACADAMYREERYRQLYWDEIILKYNPDTCDVYIRECTREDVWEIDTVADLRALEARIRHN
ncbi:phosphocholine cytidylyltransferase family protein [Selenomonas felix]|uniref:phosphocholine cytidylyltransferase family protein n=1 Tax=Selenomonas felix TaxID=1944634 RepID=UPI002354069C|nr:phosphocholine cytidylyltransferase family protein [Selenomonas felix]